MFVTAPILDVVSQPFKRAQLGLFHGKMKQYGNNVPFSKHKTRRTWLPNVQRKRIPSEGLGKEVRVKVTTRALRTIKKHGGLDNYLDNTHHELLGQEGLALRIAIREHQAQQAQRADQLALEAKLSTPEGRARHEKLELHRATQKRESDLIRGGEISISHARQARADAAKALGLKGLASANQTISWLQKRSRELGFRGRQEHRS
ncbi:hypothetical protein AX16_005036 [Volvariella volvacea WC 439]|nr:hypothetical protein AX16_005036 [Volvariella volvacea WC 439]